nr:MAG TPA: hypothetical protein [Caudoviricetes sp.]
MRVSTITRYGDNWITSLSMNHYSDYCSRPHHLR